MVKMCNNCRHWHFAEMEEEWQCWNNNCIHEGEERDNLRSACEKWGAEIDAEEEEAHEECKECRSRNLFQRIRSQYPAGN